MVPVQGGMRSLADLPQAAVAAAPLVPVPVAEAPPPVAATTRVTGAPAPSSLRSARSKAAAIGYEAGLGCETPSRGRGVCYLAL